MKKAILQYATGPHQAWMRIGAEPLRRYAARHGYDLVLRHWVACDRPPSWAKLLLFRELFAVGYELVVWIDADAIIVDLERDIADELEDGKDFYLVQHHINGDDPNCGIWMLRASEAVADCLTAMWQQLDLVHDPWWEQGAFLRLIGHTAGWYEAQARGSRFIQHPALLDRVKWIDPAWNSLSRYAEVSNPRIMHFAGQDHTMRDRNLRTALETFHANWGAEVFAYDLTLLVTSAGQREGIASTFDSIDRQIGRDRVEVLVIGDARDGPLPALRSRVEERGYRYLEIDAGERCWANLQRNVGVMLARGRYISFVDDDDVLEPRAVEQILNAIAELTELRPLLFRFQPPPGHILWDERHLAAYHISGQCLVVPNVPSRMGHWDATYLGDFAFIRSTIDRWGGDAAIVWREELIARSKPR
jgi:hypothetical protein